MKLIATITIITAIIIIIIIIIITPIQGNCEEQQQPYFVPEIPFSQELDLQQQQQQQQQKQ